jgi:hypothetical protein
VQQQISIQSAHTTEAHMNAACDKRVYDADKTQLHGGEDDDGGDDSGSGNTREEVLEVLRTGAKITLRMSVELIHYYCDTLPGDRYTQRLPEFEFMTPVGAGESAAVGAGGQAATHLYMCELRLPCDAAVRHVRSQWCGSKKEAKRMAALAACHELRQLGALNDCLLPIRGGDDDDDDSASSGSDSDPAGEQGQAKGKGARSSRLIPRKHKTVIPSAVVVPLHSYPRPLSLIY